MIVFFARDAGAANVLAAVYGTVEGPKQFWAKDYARDVLKSGSIDYLDFNRVVADRAVTPGDRAVIGQWVKSLDGVDRIVTGTTHQDDFTDRLVWQICPEKGISTTAYLDQWLRVEERFVVNGEQYRPDIIACPSRDIADRLNEKGLARDRAIVVGHPYLSELHKKREEILSRRPAAREQIAKILKADFETLVVLASEPQKYLISKGAQFAGVPFDEIEVYEFVKNAFDQARLSDALLAVKLHPKEDGREYRGKGANVIKEEVSNYDLIAASDVIIGVKSMFLIEAVVLGKPVLSIDLWNLPEEQLITNELGLSRKIASSDELIFCLETAIRTLNKKDGSFWGDTSA